MQSERELATDSSIHCQGCTDRCHSYDEFNNMKYHKIVFEADK